MTDSNFRHLTEYNYKEILNVINSRPTMRNSKHKAPDYTDWLKKPETYKEEEGFIVHGYYVDRVLWGVIINKIWGITGFGIYSKMIFTRPIKHEYYDNGYPILTTQFFNLQLEDMEARGYKTLYDIYAGKWNSYGYNKYCRLYQYETTTVEKIPAGSLPKSMAFKAFLMNRFYDVDSTIIRYRLEDK